MSTQQAVDAIRACNGSALLLRRAGRERWAFRFEREGVSIAEAHGLLVTDVLNGAEAPDATSGE